jgi:hypothetical protein
MADGFDIVAVGIEHEGGVIVGVIVSTDAGTTVVPGPGCDCSAMKGVNSMSDPSLEGEMQGWLRVLPLLEIQKSGLPSAPTLKPQALIGPSTTSAFATYPSGASTFIPQGSQPLLP